LELAEAKVRVITPDNKIIELDKSNIKESEVNDEIGAHYYFAIDGIEKGSDIEIFYTVLRMPVYDGKRVAIQNESLKKINDFIGARFCKIILIIIYMRYTTYGKKYKNK
jgi:hypothetical protein